jgi:hypothetical protein
MEIYACDVSAELVPLNSMIGRRKSKKMLNFIVSSA